ncbi:MAG: hypothetical protein Q9167_003616 [Letrouitia subvulpina]
MMRFKEGDDEKLRQAKVEVETDFERKKWAKIVAAMEANGADKYPHAFLEKKWKEMAATGATAATNSVNRGVASDADGEAQPNGEVKAEADGEDSAMTD